MIFGLWIWFCFICFSILLILLIILCLRWVLNFVINNMVGDFWLDLMVVCVFCIYLSVLLLLLINCFNIDINCEWFSFFVGIFLWFRSFKVIWCMLMMRLFMVVIWNVISKFLLLSFLNGNCEYCVMESLWMGVEFGLIFLIFGSFNFVCNWFILSCIVRCLLLFVFNSRIVVSKGICIFLLLVVFNGVFLLSIFNGRVG